MSYKGRYTIKNPQKYVGDYTKIIYRSLKERSIMAYFDKSPKVLRWNSEDVVIPYHYDVDGKMHRYFMDFYAEIRCNDGEIRTYLFEYKPKSKLTPPRKPKNTKRRSKKRESRFLYEQMDYIKNSNKWEQATKYAKARGWLFFVIHEDHVKGMNYFNSL